MRQPAANSAATEYQARCASQCPPDREIRCHGLAQALPPRRPVSREETNFPCTNKGPRNLLNRRKIDRTCATAVIAPTSRQKIINSKLNTDIYDQVFHSIPVNWRTITTLKLIWKLLCGSSMNYYEVFMLHGEPLQLFLLLLAPQTKNYTLCGTAATSSRERVRADLPQASPHNTKPVCGVSTNWRLYLPRLPLRKNRLTDSFTLCKQKI